MEKSRIFFNFIELNKKLSTELRTTYTNKA